MDFLNVNWLAIAAGALFNMVFGALWYGPILGKSWMKLMGLNKEEIQKPSPAIFIVPAISAIIAAYVLNLFIHFFQVTHLLTGLGFGALLWTGFVATTSVTKSTFDDKNLGVWAIYAFYQLLVFGIEGAVFAIWQ